MPKILVFDGDCPMCGWIARRFGELGLAAEGQRRPYQSFDGDLAQRMEAAGIRNEMLVLDEASGELRSGIDGFLWLLDGSRWSWARPLLSWAPIRGLMRLVYRTIAYNRRILAPPPRGIVCACDPDPAPGFRALLLASLGLFAAAGALLFGVAAAAAFPGIEPLPGFAVALAAMAASWLGFQFVSSRAAIEVLGHDLVALTIAVALAAPFLAMSLLLTGNGARLLVVVASALALWRWWAVASSRLRPTRPTAVPRARSEADG